MWSKSFSAALLLCGSLLLSTPVFVASQRENSNCIAGVDCPAIPTSQRDLSSISPPVSEFHTGTAFLTSTSRDEVAPPPATVVESTTAPASTAATTKAVKAGPSKSKTNTGAIAGGVVGGLLALVLIAAGAFIFLRRRSKRVDSFELEKSPSTSAAPRASSPPEPTSQIPIHEQPIGSGDALMSHYGESQPQNVTLRGDSAPQMVYSTGEVIPAVNAPKPYVVGASREIDDDEISIDPPSPTITPNPERQQQRSVPRLPIYQSSREDANATAGL